MRSSPSRSVLGLARQASVSSPQVAVVCEAECVYMRVGGRAKDRAIERSSVHACVTSPSHILLQRSFRPSAQGPATCGAGGGVMVAQSLAAKFGSKGAVNRVGHDRPPLPTKHGISFPDTSLNLAQLSRLSAGPANANPFHPASSTRGAHVGTPHATSTPHQATPVSALRASARTERRHMARLARDSHDFNLIQTFFKREREHASSTFRYPWPDTDSPFGADAAHARGVAGGGWASVLPGAVGGSGRCGTGGATGNHGGGNKPFLDMSGYEKWQGRLASHLRPVV